jgi:hypothetical protein
MKKSKVNSYKIDEDGFILKAYDDPIFTIKELKELIAIIKKTLKFYVENELNDNEIKKLNEDSRGKKEGVL